MGENEAYLAGLFDGEGYVSVNATNGHPHSIQIGINMADKDLINYINECYPGSLCINNVNRVSNHHEVYTWRVSGNNALPFIHAILPYSRGKREVLLLAIDFIKTMNHTEITAEKLATRQNIRTCIINKNKEN